MEAGGGVRAAPRRSGLIAIDPAFPWPLIAFRRLQPGKFTPSFAAVEPLATWHHDRTLPSSELAYPEVAQPLPVRHDRRDADAACGTAAAPRRDRAGCAHRREHGALCGDLGAGRAGRVRHLPGQRWPVALLLPGRRRARGQGRHRRGSGLGALPVPGRPAGGASGEPARPQRRAARPCRAERPRRRTFPRASRQAGHDRRPSERTARRLQPPRRCLYRHPRGQPRHWRQHRRPGRPGGPPRRPHDPRLSDRGQPAVAVEPRRRVQGARRRYRPHHGRRAAPRAAAHRPRDPHRGMCPHRTRAGVSRRAARTTAAGAAGRMRRCCRKADRRASGACRCVRRAVGRAVSCRRAGCLPRLQARSIS